MISRNMIYTALGVKFNIFRFFPVSLRMVSGFFYFRIFPKRFFSVRLVNSSMMCYNKKREQIFVIVKNICLLLEVGVWKERIYAVI